MKPKRLLVAFNRIGDLVLQTTLFRQLAQTGELSLLTRPFGRPLLQGQSYIQDVFTLDHPSKGKHWLTRGLFMPYEYSLRRQLRDYQFDELLYYAGERPHIQKLLSGLFPQAKTRILSSEGVTGSHAIDAYFAAGQSIGMSELGYSPTPRLEVTASAQQRARAQLSSLGAKLVGIQMGSQRTHERRPWARKPNLKGLSVLQWCTFIERLLRSDPAIKAVFHGAPNEQRDAQTVIRRLPKPLQSRCVSLTQSVGLELLPALLSEHAAMISIDTGPAHIAAAVGCPLLVFFGPSDPKEWGLRGDGPIIMLQGQADCMPCMGTSAYRYCRNNVCMQAISDEAIWQGWLQLS